MADGHRWPVRVYYEDTDATGIVYHAAYLRFAERARTEALRARGFDHVHLRQRGLLLAVRRATCDFLAPARLDDHLEVVTSTVRLGGASFDLGQEIRRADQVLVRLTVRVAALGLDLRPARLPRELHEAWRASG